MSVETSGETAVARVRNDYLGMTFHDRWATDQADPAAAIAIAAHTTIIANGSQQYEPVGWAEELLPAAVAANLAHLPRPYTAASNCTVIGRPRTASGTPTLAVGLQSDPGYQPFNNG